MEDDKKMHVLKFDDQMSAVEQMGYNVWYLGVDRHNVYLCNKDNRIRLLKIKEFKNEMLNKISIHYSLYKSISKVIKIKSQFDFVYVRTMPVIPQFLNALRKLSKVSKYMVLEIPSYPIDNEIMLEEKLIRRLMFKVWNALEKKQSKYIDLFTIIGERCKEYLGKPALNISNGIDINKTSIRKPVNKKGEIHILALAKMAKWHAYDRLINGLYEYKQKNNKHKIIIHFVGNDTDGSGQEWKILAKEKGLEDCILFEGPLYGDKLDYMFNLCDVGVGALGLYRKKSEYTSELKIREYCARGLPFVYAAKDESLEGDLEFCIMESNDNTPINFEKVVDFAIRCKNNAEIPKIMRDYAKQNLTWFSQFNKIKEKLKEIINE